jgi:hypothetical protein
MPIDGGFVIGGRTTHLAPLGLYTAAVGMINDLAAALNRNSEQVEKIDRMSYGRRFLAACGEVLQLFSPSWHDNAIQSMTTGLLRTYHTRSPTMGTEPR